MAIPYESLYKKVQDILKNKIEEFHFLGYEAINEQDLWHYCIDKLWRKEDVQTLRLYQLASGILNVKSSEIIHYIQISSFKEDFMHAELTKEELNNLFNHVNDDLFKKSEK